MTKQTVNVGTSANDRTGDNLRSAFAKINANFDELYTELGLNLDTDLNLGAFEFTGSTLTTTDSSAVVIDQATTITSNLTVGGDILPTGNLNADLGSATNRFRDLYLSGSTIDLGGTTLSIVDGKLQIGGADVGATVSYDEITDTPTIPSALSDLTNDLDYASIVGVAIQNNGLPVLPTQTLDIEGSVFADDSTVLVDGVNGTISADNLTGTIPANVEGRNIITHWGKLDGTSIRNSSGNFTVSTVGNDLLISFDTPMSNDDYVVNVVMDTGAQPRFSGVYSLSTNGFRIQAWRVVTDSIGPGGGTVVPFQDESIGSYSFHFMVIGT